MKAVLSHVQGGPESLVIEDIEEPIAGPRQIVVQIRAVGLNFADTLLLQDRYQFRPERPFSPGGECAGIIESVGHDVIGLQPGDRVVAYVKWGAVREKIAVDAHQAIVMPDELDFEHAAGLIVTYGTSLHAYRDRAQLKAGDWVVVLGASGGVGQAAIEIAKLLGARVLACASSDEKLAFCRNCGADETINYAKEDLKTGIKALTQGQGADIVYDPVGGVYSEAALRAIAWNGRFLVIGFASGDIPSIPLNLTLLKGCQIVGVFWTQAIAQEPLKYHENVRQLMKWRLADKIGPHIDVMLPIEKTAEALQRIAERKVHGKIIICL